MPAAAAETQTVGREEGRRLAFRCEFEGNVRGCDAHPGGRHPHRDVQHDQQGDRQNMAIGKRRKRPEKNARDIKRTANGKHGFVGEAVGDRAPLAQHQDIGDLAQGHKRDHQRKFEVEPL